MRGVLRTQLGGAARRPARFLLTGLAVLVASFVVYATVLAQQITVKSLLNGLSTTPAAASLVVSGEQLTPDLVTRIEKTPGVSAVAGRAYGGAEFGGQYLTLTADPGAGPLAAARLTQGRYPDKAGELAVTPRTAERMGLSVGTKTKMVTRWDDDGKPAAPVKVTVTGLVDVGDDRGDEAYAPLSTLMKFGSTTVDHIDVTAGDPERVKTALAALAGAKNKVEDAQTVRVRQAAEKADGVNDIFAVVAMFVAIAVAAAGLVAASTFRIVFAQRMRQLALLRAVGAGRGSLIRALAAEGALTGLVAGVIGVGVAYLAGLAVPLVSKSLVSPGFPVLEALGVVALAVFITVVAVLAPAFSAARVSPLEALRSAAVTQGRRSIGAFRWVSGLLLASGAGLLVAYVLLNLPGRDDKDYRPDVMLLVIVGSGALAFLALIALGPVLVRPMLAAVGWPLRKLGPTGRLAVGGVGGAPRRAAAVSVVVALGVTLIAGALVSVASERVLADRQSAVAVPADFEVTSSEPLDPAVVERIRARPELIHVAPYRRLDEITVGTTAVEGSDLPLSALPALTDLDVAEGSWRDLEPGRAVVAGYLADVASLHAGDEVTLRSAKGTATVTVAAVLPDSAPLYTGIVLTPGDLTRLGAAAGYSGLLADAARSGEDARTEAQRALRQATGGGAGVGLEVLADKRDEIDQELDMLLLIVIGLVSLTVLIAVVGVGTTTALSVVERSRESGLLRAVGLGRGGLRGMLTVESSLYGVLGATMGLLLGVPYAWLAIKALGQNMPLSLPVPQLAVVFGVLVVITALAGVLPARRAARVSPVTALGTE
ncbi:ABC transporter permease [Actinoplanes sp. NPDC051633]|uniref:ABC transporter permease n=1 Tax=Actinoplanes sp. NPDC051633 TaxID=3155670 RepID=UPI003433173E